MKKAKILYGSDELAKGALATQLADGYKDAVIVDMECLNPLSIESGWTDWTVSPETDLIIFRNVPSSFDYEIYLSLIDTGFKVNKKHEAIFHIQPDFIFITRFRPISTGESFDRRFEFIELYKSTSSEETPKRKKFIDRSSSGMVIINLRPWRRSSTRYLYFYYRRWELGFYILPF